MYTMNSPYPLPTHTCIPSCNLLSLSLALSCTHTHAHTHTHTWHTAEIKVTCRSSCQPKWRKNGRETIKCRDSFATHLTGFSRWMNLFGVWISSRKNTWRCTRRMECVGHTSSGSDMWVLSHDPTNQIQMLMLKLHDPTNQIQMLLLYKSHDDLTNQMQAHTYCRPVYQSLACL